MHARRRTNTPYLAYVAARRGFAEHLRRAGHARDRCTVRSRCGTITPNRGEAPPRTHAKEPVRMGKPRVYVTRIMPDAGLDLIRAFCEATIGQEEPPPPREVILRETRDADGLVSLL